MSDSMEIGEEGVENAGENAGKKRRRSKHLSRKVAKKAATKEAKRKLAVGLPLDRDPGVGCSRVLCVDGVPFALLPQITCRVLLGATPFGGWFFWRRAVRGCGKLLCSALKRACAELSRGLVFARMGRGVWF